MTKEPLCLCGTRGEELMFRTAFHSKIPLMIKGPTGCGKTRFIEYMAYRLQLPQRRKDEENDRDAC